MTIIQKHVLLLLPFGRGKDPSSPNRVWYRPIPLERPSDLPLTAFFSSVVFRTGGRYLLTHVRCRVIRIIENNNKNKNNNNNHINCFQCCFANSLRKFPVTDWSYEQKWTVILLPLLILFNGTRVQVYNNI